MKHPIQENMWPEIVGWEY